MTERLSEHSIDFVLEFHLLLYPQVRHMTMKTLVLSSDALGSLKVLSLKWLVIEEGSGRRLFGEEAVKSASDVWSTLFPAFQMLQQRLGQGFKVENVMVLTPNAGWELAASPRKDQDRRVRPPGGACRHGRQE